MKLMFLSIVSLAVVILIYITRVCVVDLSRQANNMQVDLQPHLSRITVRLAGLPLAVAMVFGYSVCIFGHLEFVESLNYVHAT